MSTYTSLSALFQAICNSVRKKEGTSSLINHQELPARILALPSGGAGPGTGTQKMSFGIVEAECLYFDGLNVPISISQNEPNNVIGDMRVTSLNGKKMTYWVH